MGGIRMLSRQIGRNIRWRRKRARLSLEELAYRASLDTSHIGKIERGCWNPNLQTLARIAAALHVSPRSLFNCGTLDEPDYARLIGFANSTIPYYEFFSVYDPLFLGEFLGSFLMERITVEEIDAIADQYLSEVTYEAMSESVETENGRYDGYGIAVVHPGKLQKVRLAVFRDVTTNRLLAEKIADTLTQSRVPYDQFRYIARDLAVSNFV